MAADIIWVALLFFFLFESTIYVQNTTTAHRQKANNWHELLTLRKYGEQHVV